MLCVFETCHLLCSSLEKRCTLMPNKKMENVHYCCQGVCDAGRGNTGTVARLSSPPPIGCWLFCQPMPVAWLTNCDCLNGFVVPVGWGARPTLVAGRPCWGEGLARFFANGFVPVAMACRDAGGGDWVWKGAVLPTGDDRAKGLVDVCCGWRLGWPAGADRVVMPVGCPVIIMDCRKGFVTCGAACRFGIDGAVGKEATESCGIGARELWYPDWGENPPKPAPVIAGCS